MSMRTASIGAVLAAAAAGTCQAQSGVFTVKAMTPEAASAAARAALEHCRKQGYQVAVAVVDRGGVLQAFMRDRYAGVHTVDAATRKGWTAVSFKLSTTALAAETQPGRPMSGLRGLPGVLAAGGGLPIEAGGTLLGGIGVSGAPGGEADDACAQAGIAAIADLVEF